MKKGKKPHSITVDDERWEKLEKMADKRDISVSHLVRIIIDNLGRIKL